IMPAGASEYVYQVWGTSTTNLWVASSNGILHYNGSTWTKATGTSFKVFGSIWGSAANDIWALGTDVMHFDGPSWTHLNKFPVANPLVDKVWGLAQNNVWVTGYQGELYHWDGAQWSGGPAFTASEHSAVWASSTADLWVAGDIGEIHRWDGVKWTDLT